MEKLMRISLVLGFMIMLSAQLFAQGNVPLKSFDKNSVIYAKQLEDFMKTSSVSSSKKIAEEFLVKWNTAGVFKKEQQDSIISFSNLMLARGMRPSPDFEDFLVATMNFITNKHNPANFNKWFVCLRKLVVQKNKRINTYLTFSINLFKDNSLNLSTSNQWVMSNKNFEIVYDSVPKVIVSSASLTCYSHNISTHIYNTSGVCYPIDKRWEGKNGTINWSRVKLDTTKVYAELNNYRLNLASAEFAIDSVRFYYKGYFNEALPGRLIEKLTVNKGPDDDDYPKFDSYKSSYFIKDLFKGVDYRGGFGMTGNRFRGSGANGVDASIMVYRNGKIAAKAFSEAFVIYLNKVVSTQVKATIHVGEKDSIYHPMAEFKYFNEGRKVVVSKGLDGISSTDFTDSYHHLLIDVEVITWPIDEDNLEMGMIASGTNREAIFESDNYYREFRYRKMEGLANVHPLVTLKRLVEKQTQKVTTIEAYAKAYKLQEKQVLEQLRELVVKGFIRLDEKHGEILVLQRAINYVRFNAGNLDYDVIRLRSVAKGTNAMMNLNTLDLNLKGVTQFFLSDSQSVFISPLNGELKVKQDLNMDFKGLVHAGLFDFYGQGFRFDYANFKVDLDHVDSMKFKVKGPPDERGVQKTFEVKSVVEDVSGRIAVDKANNKSGLKDFPQYPVFESTKNSYVYYDRKNAQGSVYDRKRFYFTVYPFTVDSLDNVNAASDLIFQGEMYSDGIFPIFKEGLVLRPDSSLGFLTKTPAEGYPNFRGKGQYYNAIDLSNRGFFGEGKLTYLSSTAQSKSFLFFLDSMNTNASDYAIEKTGINPEVKAPTPYIHWASYTDSMFIYKGDKPIEMYGLQGTHDGRLVYTPRDLTGTGSTNFNNASHVSLYTKFNPDDFTADTASIRLNSSELSTFALRGDNVRSKVDFLARKGTFLPNNQKQLVDFPFNQFKTSLNQFTWFFDEFRVEFTPPASNTQQDNFLLSVAPSQDSLKIFVEKVNYDLKSYLIDAEGVASVLVADAEIFPFGKKMQIKPKAEIQQLENARIIADNTNKYHLIYEANVTIQGAKKYIGNGSYDYVDREKKVQKVIFTQIGVDTGMHTVAKALLQQSQDFKLDKHFSFYGDAFLRANQKYLSYDGFAKIIENSTAIEASYFNFKGEINPDTVRLPIDSIMKNPDGRKVFAGVELDNLGAQSYGAFMSTKTDASDHSVTTTKGNLIFDEKSKKFKIGQDDKLYGEGLKGSYLTLLDTAEKLYYEGPFNFGVEFSEKFKLKAAGQATVDLTAKKAILTSLATLDFQFQKDAFKQLLAVVKNNVIESPAPHLDTVGFYKALSEMVPEKTATKVIQGLKLFSEYKNSGDLNQTIVLTNLKLVWDQNSKSYKSEGSFGLLTIGNEEIVKMVNGCVQIVRKPGEDVVNLYFECGGKDTWFFFSYRGGLVEAFSSDGIFNTYLQEKSKAKDPFTISTAKKKVDFLREFNNR